MRAGGKYERWGWEWGGCDGVRGGFDMRVGWV